MNISRGFRRLSVLAAVCGLSLIVFVRFANWDYEWTLSDYLVSSVVIGAPALLALLIGWVVAGFQKQSPDPQMKP